MNITHETNHQYEGLEPETKSVNNMNDLLRAEKKSFISSDLNLFQRLWDWILH